MIQRSYKSKLIIAATLFVLALAALFGYVYPLLTKHNQAMLAEVESRKKEYAELQSERRSFELGQRDIAALAGKSYQPDNLFNSDKRVVSEVEMLEKIALENNISFQLQVTGTSATAAKAPKTVSGVLVVPYAMTLTGEFGDLVQFVDRLEHMPFITHVQGVTIANSSGTTLRATLKAQFYIRQ